MSMTTEGVPSRAAFSPAEVGARMGVPIGAVYRLIHAGDLRTVKVGRLHRIPQDALAEFLAGDAPAED
ncbi:excisionase family DNA-binding protein [Demequina subtropica]|uniref:excisionase family DNA-binding protein n=1 Tax=Demequina subtropica TaxID=1638989 RepID=UPI0007826260|nr:helix-turn-helix domain-containing protein [Demequina subtropica]